MNQTNLLNLFDTNFFVEYRHTGVPCITNKNFFLEMVKEFNSLFPSIRKKSRKYLCLALEMNETRKFKTANFFPLDGDVNLFIGFNRSFQGFLQHSNF